MTIEQTNNNTNNFLNQLKLPAAETVVKIAKVVGIIAIAVLGVKISAVSFLIGALIGGLGYGCSRTIHKIAKDIYKDPEMLLQANTIAALAILGASSYIVPGFMLGSYVGSLIK